MPRLLHGPDCFAVSILGTYLYTKTVLWSWLFHSLNRLEVDWSWQPKVFRHLTSLLFVITRIPQKWFDWLRHNITTTVSKIRKNIYLLSIGLLGTNFNEILIWIWRCSFNKIPLKSHLQNVIVNRNVKCGCCCQHWHASSTVLAWYNMFTGPETFNIGNSCEANMNTCFL